MKLKLFILILFLNYNISYSDDIIDDDDLYKNINVKLYSSKYDCQNNTNILLDVISNCSCIDNCLKYINFNDSKIYLSKLKYNGKCNRLNEIYYNYTNYTDTNCFFKLSLLIFICIFSITSFICIFVLLYESNLLGFIRFKRIKQNYNIIP